MLNKGSFKLFVQVFALGKAELSWKVMVGSGMKPMGGTADDPVANISISSRDN